MSAEELDWSIWNDPYRNCRNDCRHDLAPCVMTTSILSTADGPYPTRSPFTITEPIILGQSPWAPPKIGLKAAWTSAWRRNST